MCNVCVCVRARRARVCVCVCVYVCVCVWSSWHDGLVIVVSCGSLSLLPVSGAVRGMKAVTLSSLRVKSYLSVSTTENIKMNINNVGLGSRPITEYLLPYFYMATVPHKMVRLERIMD